MRGDRLGRIASRPWGRALAAVVAASAFFAGAVCLYVRNPAGSALYPPCPVHAMTGLYCPGCGTLRALHQLMHGNVQAALSLNPLAVILLPALAYGILSIGLKAVGARPLPARFIPARWIWALLVAILLYWALRNIPAYPFSLLAPHVAKQSAAPAKSQPNNRRPTQPANQTTHLQHADGR